MSLVVFASDIDDIDIDYQLLLNHISEYLIPGSNHCSCSIIVSLLHYAASVMSHVAEKGGVFL